MLYRGTLRTVFLAALMTFFFLSVCFAEESTGKLLFLGNKNIEPVVYTVHSVPKGLAVDIVQMLAKHMPQPVEIKAMDWGEAQRLVLMGEADALIQMNPSEERKKDYDFSEPMLVSYFSIFTAADRYDITELASLEGMRVGVEAGGLPQQILKARPDINILYIPDFLTGFRLLNEGKLDAVVVDYRVGTYILAQNNIQNIKAVDEPIASSYSAIAVKKGNSKLLNDINNALHTIKQDGSYQSIIDRWKSKEVVFQTREQITRNRYTAGIAILFSLFAVALMWLISLERQLKKIKDTEEKLRRQYSTLYGIINSANAPIFSVDRRFCYTSFNLAHKAAMKALYDADIELGGCLLDYMIVPEDREMARSNLLKSLAGEHIIREAYSGEEELQFRRYFQVSHSPVKMGNEIIGVAVLAHDITERKQMEDRLRLSEEKYAKVFNFSPDATGITQLDGVILEANESYIRGTGYSAEELIGKTVLELGLWANEKDRDRVIEELRRQGEISDFEARLRTKAGAVYYGSFSARIVNIDGVDCILSAVRNITERKQMEDRLRLSEEKYANIFNFSPDALSITRLDGVILEVNEKFIKGAGYSEEELIGKSVLELGLWANAGDREYVIAELDRHGVISDFEIRFRLKDGVIGYYLFSARTVSINGENCILAAVRNISERKRMEEELRRAKEILECNERRMLAIMNSLPDVMLAFNHAEYDPVRHPGEFFSSSAAIQEVNYNYVDANLSPEAAAQFKQAIGQVLATGERRTLEYRRVIEGEWRDQEARFSYSQSGEVLIVIRDITQKKQDEALKDILRQVSMQVLAGAPFTSAMKYLCQQLTAVFDLELVWTGWEREETWVQIEAASGQLMRESGGENAWKADRFTQDNVIMTHNDLKIVLKTRDELSMAEEMAPPEGPACPNPAFILGMVGKPKEECSYNILFRLDYFAEQLAIIINEAQIRRKLNLLRIGLESIPSSVLIVNRDGIIEWVNPAFVKMSGYEYGELVGKSHEALQIKTTGKNRGEVEREIADSMLRGESWLGELESRRKDGEWFPAEVIIAPVRDSQGGRLVNTIAIIRDITEKKQMMEAAMELQEKNARAEKVLSLGALSAGISHEVNQPLNCISMIASGILYANLQGKKRSAEELIEKIAEISREIDRISAIMSHLRSYMQKGNIPLKPCNLNQAVEQTLTALRKRISFNDIVLHTRLEEGLPNVLANMTALDRIISNLVTNARQILTSVEQPEKEIFIRTYFDEGVILAVSDNGPGIAPEVGQRVFEPFFSGKVNDENLGLGLAIVKSLAAACGGVIYYESGQDCGAVFFIKFPPVENNDIAYGEVRDNAHFIGG